MTAKTIRTIKDEVRNLCQRKRALTYEKNIATIKAKHIGCVVLNGMSDLAALAAVRAAA